MRPPDWVISCSVARSPKWVWDPWPNPRRRCYGTIEAVCSVDLKHVKQRWNEVWLIAVFIDQHTAQVYAARVMVQLEDLNNLRSTNTHGRPLVNTCTYSDGRRKQFGPNASPSKFNLSLSKNFLLVGKNSSKNTKFGVGVKILKFEKN